MNPISLLAMGGASSQVTPISIEQFRAMTLKGNFGGQVFPGLGLSTHDSLFDPALPFYSASVQAAILADKKAKGLNVVNLASWMDYHGSEFGMPVNDSWMKNPRLARDYCLTLRRQGVLPAFWLIPDRVAGDDYDERGGHCGGALDLLTAMVPVLRDVVACFGVGYELRGCCGAAGAPYSAAQYRQMLILLRLTAPTSYVFAHFTAENSAGSSHSPVEAGDPWHGDELGFWLDCVNLGLVNGLCYQAPTGDKLFGGNAWEDRWQEMIERLGADNRRWPPPCTTVDLCWGEAGWYDITRGDRTEAQLQAVSARALQMGGKWSFSG